MIKPPCPKCKQPKLIGDMYSYNNERMCRTCVIEEMKKSYTPNLKIIAHLEYLDKCS